MNVGGWLGRYLSTPVCMHISVCVCVCDFITDVKSYASLQTSDIHNGRGNTHFCHQSHEKCLLGECT